MHLEVNILAWMDRNILDVKLMMMSPLGDAAAESYKHG